MNESEYLKQAKNDVESCISIWSQILENSFKNKVEVVYTKGSAIKNWESIIDYVPIISDVDIHIVPKENVDFYMGKSTAFFEAMHLSQRYERMFVEENQDYLHIPRTQIVKFDDVIDPDSFIMPRKKDVRVLFGSYSEKEEKSLEFIRKIDRENILELKNFLDSLPKTIIDRTGLDLWVLIRRICWRVSPTPIRLLSLSNDEPLDLWTLNRTTIVKKLEENNFTQIAENYLDYYYEGWLAFLGNFNDSEIMRRMITLGYEVLRDCYNQIKEIKEI
ncbi:MAG: hypothetical protein V3V41_00850 [Candidatus Heimdallarchaeota archaeon]